MILCWLMLALPAWSGESSTTELLEVYRDLPHLQDQAFIVLREGREFLSMNSNLFVPGKMEIGSFLRIGDSIQPKLKAIQTSLKGGEKPFERSIALGGWHVRMFGEEIDPFDPRFEKAFQLMFQLAADQKWKGEKVISFRAGPKQIVGTKSENGHPKLTKNYSRKRVCKRSDNDFEVCQLADWGVIYLTDPQP